MNMNLVRVFNLVLFVFGFSLSACVTTRAQLNEQRSAEAEGSAKVQSEDIESSRSSVEAEPRVVEDVVKASESTPVTAPTTVPSPAPSSPSAYGVDDLKAEMARLVGRIDELEKKNQDQVQVIDDLKTKLTQAESKPVPPALTLEEAEGLMSEKEWTKAIEALTPLLDQGKKSDQEKALFLRGEAYFEAKDFEKAIVDFSKVTEKFKKSTYHPKALLRIAESFESLGAASDASVFYQELSEQFPKTAEGKLAIKRLKSSKKKK